MDKVRVALYRYRWPARCVDCGSSLSIGNSELVCSCGTTWNEVSGWSDPVRTTDSENIFELKQRMRSFQKYTETLLLARDKLHDGMKKIAQQLPFAKAKEIYQLLEADDPQTRCPCGAKSTDEYSAHTKPECPFYAT